MNTISNSGSLLRSLLTVTASAILLIEPALHADPITFNFSGTVNSVNPNLSGEFSTGQPVSGSYTFDSTLTRANYADAGVGYYDQTANANFTLQIGDYSAVSPEISLMVENNQTTDHDQYRAITYWGDGFVGPDVGGLQLSSFSIVLFDSTETAFTSTDLPLTPPVMPYQSFVLFFNRQVPQSVITGTISFSPGVPEPGSAALALLGGLGLLLRRRRATGGARSSSRG